MLRIQYIIHITYKICINWLLSVSLLVNCRLSWVKFWGIKIIWGFSTAQQSVPLTPTSFRHYLYVWLTLSHSMTSWPLHFVSSHQNWSIWVSFGYGSMMLHRGLSCLPKSWRALGPVPPCISALCFLWMAKCLGVTKTNRSHFKFFSI